MKAGTIVKLTKDVAHGTTMIKTGTEGIVHAANDQSASVRFSTTKCFVEVPKSKIKVSR